MNNKNDEPLYVEGISLDQEKFPDLSGIQPVVLKDGPRVKKVAKITSIQSRHTNSPHHKALGIVTIRRNSGEWGEDEKHSVTLEGDEMWSLYNLLYAVKSEALSQTDRDHVVFATDVGEGSAEQIQRLLAQVTSSGKVELVSQLLAETAGNEALLDLLISRASRDPQLFAEASAALNLATYRVALKELQELICSDEACESNFQRLLAANPWMFGSEYSKLLNRRHWTRDEQQDFVARRTTDGYIELLEIKTPLSGAELFRYDSSHDNYYAGVDLAKATGQVQKYIEQLEAQRLSIIAIDKEDTLKIRAKIIIGRDGNEEQQKALRRYNGHLHQIEVLTFDQLAKIAQNVLSYLENAVRPDPLPENALE